MLQWIFCCFLGLEYHCSILGACPKPMLAKIILTSKFQLLTFFFPNSTHKTKNQDLQVVFGEITNSNPVGPITLSTQSEETESLQQKYDLTVCLLDSVPQASSRALKSCTTLFPGVPATLPVDSLDQIDEPHIQDFHPVQGSLTY